jgi:outer membrane protein assembly factor BamB
MKSRRTPLRPEYAIPLAAAVLAGVVVVSWLSLTGPADVSRRVPVDREPLFVVEHTRKAGEPELTYGPGEPGALKGCWPQFRGADRTNTVSEGPTLARSWPAEGLKELWRLPVGSGYSGAAICDGRVYLADYDEENEGDAVRCLSLEDGQEIWRHFFPVFVKYEHGMSRAVPAVSGDHVVVVGPRCDVYCLDADTGELNWQMDLVDQFGTQVPEWHASQCPLIEDGNLILAPGGAPLMMAIDVDSGQTLWETPNPGEWGMTHSSIAGFDHPAGRQYVYCTTRGVVGVAASDGRLLWKFEDWKIPQAVVPTPVPVGKDRIFLSGGYESGCVMIHVTGQGAEMVAEEDFRLGHREFGAEQATPILYEGLIYGVIPSGQLACLAPSGERRWVSERKTRFELGPYIMVDGMLLVLHGRAGTLHLMDVGPGGYSELASARILSGREVWGPLAIVGDRLVARDFTEMVCVALPGASP